MLLSPPLKSCHVGGQLRYSKARNSSQQEQDRQWISKIIGEVSDCTIMTFIDRSRITNPRPCGTKTVIYYPEKSSPTTLKCPV